MRMWMVDPKLMCDRHLLGEHCELHMLVGCVNLGRSIDGYIQNDLIEPASINARHDRLVSEMKERGFRHRSPLAEIRTDFKKYVYYNHRINRENSLKDLVGRCVSCRKKYLIQQQ